MNVRNDNRHDGLSRTHLGRPVFRACTYLFILAPLLISFLYIRAFGVNVIYGDEWSFVPFIEKFYGGTLTLGDLFQNHCEHRMFFPRIIMLILARLTHYDTIAELYCSWGLAAFTSALLYKLYKKDFGHSAFALLKFVPVPWLLLSLRQSESLLWGFELLMYLCVAGVVASIYMLEMRSKLTFLGAILAAIIASFSSVNGLLVWPIGILFILLSLREEGLVRALTWAVIGIAIWALYFHDGASIMQNSNVSFVFEKPLTALIFLVVNIGSPLAFVKSSAIGMGAVVAVLMIAALAIATVEGARENAKWSALILFSLGSSLLFMAGRAKFGYWAALASRYFIFTILGVIALYLSVMSFHDKSQNLGRRTKYAVLYGAVLSLVIVGIVCGYASGIVLGRETRDARRLMAERLVNYRQTSDNDLGIVFYDITKVRERAQFLEKSGLNVFSHRP